MITALLIVLILLVCGASAAMMAGNDLASRRQWFWAGCLTGPLALLAQFALVEHVPGDGYIDPHRRRDRGGVLVNLFLVIVGAGLLVLAVFVGLEEWRAHERYAHRTQFLDRWHQIGDGLLRAARVESGAVVDTFVIRVTRAQVGDFRDSLAAEQQRTAQFLELAASGYRQADGAEWLYRKVRSRVDGTLSDPRRIPLTDRDRAQQVALFSSRMESYGVHLATIDSALAVWHMDQRSADTNPPVPAPN